MIYYASIDRNGSGYCAWITGFPLSKSFGQTEQEALDTLKRAVPHLLVKYNQDFEDETAIETSYVELVETLP